MAAKANALERISALALQSLGEKHQAREDALRLSRTVIRGSANAIRAVHRNELDLARDQVAATRAVVVETRAKLADYPDVYFSGFTLDAQKEYAEAESFYAFIAGTPLRGPDDLNIEVAPYLNGLAEAASELRRYILDSLRRFDDERCEELMATMDEVYNAMLLIDFPDSLTGGLRRTTDTLRAVLERTRGDLTLLLRQRRLEVWLCSKQSHTSG